MILPTPPSPLEFHGQNAILLGIRCSTTKKDKRFIRISGGFRGRVEIDRGSVPWGTSSKNYRSDHDAPPSPTRLKGAQKIGWA